MRCADKNLVRTTPQQLYWLGFVDNRSESSIERALEPGEPAGSSSFSYLWTVRGYYDWLAASNS